jgi:uncharacterized phage-associated protein
MPTTTPTLRLRRDDAKYSANQIANYFLGLVDTEAGDTMTNLKLQKLLYYAQGYHVASFGKPLFPEGIEAWVHGPAIPAVYRRFKHCGYNPIDVTGITAPELDTETREFLDQIWTLYGKYSAKYLEELSHRDVPWKEARKGYEPGENCSTEINLSALHRHFQQYVH